MISMVLESLISDKKEKCHFQENLKSMNPIKIVLCHPDAKLPSDQGMERNAGYDLYACSNTVIRSKTHGLVSTGIKIQLPADKYGRIAPRSGLAYKHGIDVYAGVIDANYVDEVGVILYNSGDKDFYVQKGDRIAQLIIENYYKPGFEVASHLDTTDRIGGFESTGR